MKVVRSGPCPSYAEDGEEVVLVDKAGEPVVTGGIGDGNGEAVAAVELRAQSGRITQYVL